MLADGTTVYSYVAIRSDEEYREGYSSRHVRLVIELPFKQAGIDKAGVLEILDSAGLGLPKYYSWRTRSGCTLLFLPAKGRMGATQGAAPRSIRGSQGL